MLGVGNSDGTVQLWDVASSKLIRSMGGHTDRVRARLIEASLSYLVCLFHNVRVI